MSSSPLATKSGADSAATFEGSSVPDGSSAGLTGVTGLGFGASAAGILSRVSGFKSRRMKWVHTASSTLCGVQASSPKVIPGNSVFKK